MAFKDDMAGDLENVFFNPEEFADEHTFAGFIRVIWEMEDKTQNEENRNE